MEGRDKTFVKVAFTRLKEKLDALVAINNKVRSPGAEVPLGAASREFSSLVTGSWGIGGGVLFGKPKANPVAPTEDEDIGREPETHDVFVAESLSPASNPVPDTPVRDGDRQPGGREVPDDRTGLRPDVSAQDARTGWESLAGTLPAAPRPQPPAVRPKVQYVAEPYYESRDGHVVLVQEFRLPVPGTQQVSPQLSILLPGNGVRETDPPIGAARPEFFGWESERGLLDRTNEIVVSGGPDIWRLLVVPAPDTVTEIGVAVRRAEVAW